jgi:hypothetical protein
MKCSSLLGSKALQFTGQTTKHYADQTLERRKPVNADRVLRDNTWYVSGLSMSKCRLVT